MFVTLFEKFVIFVRFAGGIGLALIGAVVYGHHRRAYEFVSRLNPERRVGIYLCQELADYGQGKGAAFASGP